MKTDNKSPIYFYSTNDLYGEFSNFYQRQIKYKNVFYCSSEAAYQAQKFPHDKDVQQKIQNATSPGEAAKLGRSKKYSLRKDWDSVRVTVMMEVLWAKFSQHKDLAELLLSTEERTLIEHTTRDNFWGDGGDSSGKNKLGKCLMKIRHLLRKSQAK